MAYIAVDAGHSKYTFPPSKGIYKGGKGYPEYDFNKKLAKSIVELLRKNGHKVIQGQPYNGKEVSLRSRTNLYNKEKVDLVISVHANYNSSPSVNGRCAFYWGTSSKSKSLANSVINAIKAKGYSTHGNGLHAGKQGSWTNLHINRETRMPAVLVEHGFMSGNKDFDLVFGKKQDQYIKDMAEADVKGIQNWLGESFKGEATVSPSKPNKPKPSKPKKTSTSGGSVVDYMNKNKMDSSFNNRKKLARQYGIVSKESQYTGTAKQNKQLLDAMRKGTSAKSSKSIKQMAKEVSEGKHGTGHSNRRKSLNISEKEYAKVRAEVNRQAGVSKKSAAQVADEIYRGKGNWGTGSTRRARLKKAGYNPHQVQSLVNKKFR